MAINGSYFLDDHVSKAVVHQVEYVLCDDKNIEQSWPREGDVVSPLRLIVVVVSQRNFHSINYMVPQGVLLCMSRGMRLHSCIAQVEFEREHDMYFMILLSLVNIIFLNNFSLYYTCFKLLYIEMSSVQYHELSFRVEYLKLSILS